MTPISKTKFISWLAERRLSFDKEWGYIKYPESSSDSRFWLQPTGVPRLIYTVSTLFGTLSPWQNITLFRQGGSWMPEGTEGIIEKTKRSWLMPLGLPQSGTCALQFDESETEQAISLFTYQQMFGMCVWDDTYAIPDHANQLVHTSHHDVIRVEFRSCDEIAVFIENMKKDNFDLPGDVPDATFKVPHWMERK